MRTLLDFERLGTDKWRFRVRREDAKGNVEATAAVDGSGEQVRSIAVNSMQAWARADEVRAQREKKLRRGKP
ncbi:hypothetical protein D3C83_110020 [compost metagenome]